ncbi:hypothetical protein CFC21_090460 [Triticum aestivum]|uniref:BED-type domain-containing protein n=2 Tax=Triticum aestivum TaxID=4565 RepID=A0A9R1LEA3_WHEAT|nr:hypothetical protein CFC21_090460 [Triticum aestivum]
MDAVEDTMLEAAIGWLADTILANLPDGGKLDSWIRQAGLGNDIGKLKAEVEAVEMLVSAVQGRAARNKPLAKSLACLKELLYDADDVVDELDCCRLQQHELQPGTLLQTQQVEGSRENAGDVQRSSKGRLRFEGWNHFDIIESEQNGGPARARCKRCQKELKCKTKNGTSVLHKHLETKACQNSTGGASHPSSSTAHATAIPMPVVTGDSPNRKRMRTGQESTHIAAVNPNRWNKDTFPERIQGITSQLQVKREAVTKLLKILGPDSGGASSNHCHITISDPHRRTSGLVQGKVYGRAQERGSIKKLIQKHKSTEGVTVLPIVGIGGVGKTALAQLVYNDPALESQFDHKIWIWVSNNFDEMRLTREMLDYVSHETHDGLCSFPKLQEVLKGHFKSKRVLLILDDVWEAMDDGQWNTLLAPFKSDGAIGNLIILTTRKPFVAKRRGTVGPVSLGALEKDHFWQLFKSCAFGDVNYEAQASLSDLGQEIAQKLKGNPLAAQTAGALLRQHLTVDHWSNILKTEAWKSLQHTGGIMSSLKLSYDELPYPIQQCWSYCSIFLYGDEFLAEELVHLWISQGFVKRDHSSKSLEEIGRYYLTYLVNLGLFEQVERYILPFDGVTKTGYAMCGLMHDFARLASKTECAALDGLQCNDILPTVHHLSIVTTSIYRWDDQTGNIPRSEKFEFLLQNIATPVRKLRTLVLIGNYDSFFFKAFHDEFEKAHNLRLLQMSATSANFNSFMCSLANPTRLRYLKLVDTHTEQKTLPHVLSKFLHLQVLDVFIGLHTVHLEDCGEWRIISSLEMLRFLKRLKLRSMRRVKEISFPSLEELVLDGMTDLQRCSCLSMGDMRSSLRVLEIQSCPALEVFDLFRKDHNYEIEPKP